MKTVAIQDVLNTAAVFAQRSVRQLPSDEKALLQAFVATEFQNLITAQIWPELVPEFLNVIPANNQFSRNEGQPNEIGDILAILSQNPHLTEYWRHIPFSVGDDVVYLEDPITSVWVEYLLPYPGVTFVDLAPLAYADFLAALVPRRFRNILAHKAAGHLLGTDNNQGAAGVQYGLADRALTTEVNRLAEIPVPKWRGFHAPVVRKRRLGSPAPCA